MRYIKKYEEINTNSPEIGDWVICETHEEKILDDFMLNNIGRVIKKYEEAHWDFAIFYEKLPKEIEDYCEWLEGMQKMVFPCTKEEILYWSKDKNELEYILAANKYNL